MSSGAAAAAAIAWIDGPGGGRWGAPEQLSVPLSERGLSLADGLFETVLVQGGRPHLLEAHLQRWCRGATVLGLPPPPGLERVLALAAEAISRSGIHTGALRLNWSRGDGERGLDLPAAGAARFWLQLSPCRPSFHPVRVIISRLERRNASSAISGCKTFAYGASVLARREACEAGQDDALLLSTAGGLCCGTTANLLVRHRERWLTPPLGSGCLAGVMRAQALALGLAQEASEAIEPAQLQAGALLLNSLGCRPIQSLATQELGAVPEAEPFWRQLLGAG
ncbi:aminotransferase class IV [Cyanobium sp. LEGE 06143]|uniref:aminotransferase class IV n=1 Tax=Cyanobium sp. LEGE 06143 TaxID=945727 RepID=UPI00188012B3|nr:aminotransferase class IV [Cyanobium sp. LEGE 06143]MBE9172049.1 aminotransferase class IV [Cyanobium sp. LEGE 06143]